MEGFLLNRLFLLVLSLSLSGTLIGILIAVFHPITGKYFSKKWNYYIWLLVVVRLMFPFHMEPDFLRPLNLHIDISPYSAPNKIEPAAPDRTHDTIPSTAVISTDTLNVPDNTADSSVNNTRIIPQSTAHTRTTLPADTLTNTKISAARLLTAAAYMWVLGAVAALFIRLLNYQRFKRSVKKDCVRITDHRITALENVFCARLHIQKIPAIYESPTVSGPMTIGLWNPAVIIPAAFSGSTDSTFQLALHHELVHVARKDLLYKWAYQLLLCVHWFNPVLYLIGGLINRDCELSCDEAILSKLTQNGKRIYGNILLDTAERTVKCRQNAFSTPLLDSKENLKKRLDHILQYQKITRPRQTLSVCTLAVALLLTACGSVVWISPDTVSDGKDYDTSTDLASDSDSSIFSPLFSSDAFLNHSSRPDQSSDAWRVYDDDALLAGEDIKDNWAAFSYRGGGSHIKASAFILYGSDSFLIAYADKDVDVEITSSFDIAEGNFKLVYIAPDQSIQLLNDTGAESTQTITMKQGRNVLKIVGQGAKLRNLDIDYTSIKKLHFQCIYQSEEEEYTVHIVDDVLSGKPFKKDKIIDALVYMDAEDASDVFNALLTTGTAFTAEELCDFFIYSDDTLSSQYLLQAVQAGDIEPPDADTIVELMPYLEGEIREVLLKSLPTEVFYDTFAESIYYLNNSQIDACLTDFLDRGGIVTYSMYSRISPYIDNSSILRRLDKQLPDLPIKQKAIAVTK